MESIFLKLVNLSITAIWLILAVIVLRLIFRKAPKWIFCVLWGLVAVRLIIPVSFESRFSLIPSVETLPADILDSDTLRIHSGIAFINNLNPKPDENGKSPDESSNEISDLSLSDGTAFENGTYEVGADKTAASGRSLRYRIRLLSYIWAVGFAVMLGYALISYILLKIRLRTAVREDAAGKRRIFRSENVPDPFVLGIIRPCIYLPFALNDEDLKYVIAHEEAHIKRRDHIWKFLGFVLLSIYWFNPFLWIAYIMLCNDIECACDEKVIATLGETERQSYSVALLNSSIAVTRKHIIACPVAFGEVSVKTRIKNVMNYKKPVFWIIIAAVAGCIVLTVCFLTNPIKKSEALARNTSFSDDFLDFENVMISQNVYDLIDEEWKRYESMDEMHRLTSSRTPGFCYRYFDTWEELCDFVGIYPANPLENEEWKTNIPEKGNIPLTYGFHCYGDHEGNINELSMEAYYPLEKGHVDLSYNIIDNWGLNAWPADEIASHMTFTVKSTVPGVSTKQNCDVAIVHEHEDQYDAVRIALPSASNYKYSVNIVSLDGINILEDEVNTVCRMLGLDLEYKTIVELGVLYDDIPGTDIESDTDYFIDVNPDTEDTTDRIDINWK